GRFTVTARQRDPAGDGEASPRPYPPGGLRSHKGCMGPEPSSQRGPAMHLPTLSSRRLAGAAVMACAAALIPVAALAATAPPAAPAGASAPPCPPAGLVLWLSTGSPAAGTFYYHVNFTNLSGHACTLRGHPGVSAANLGGTRVGTPAGWSNPGNAKLRSIRLANGATAIAVLAVTDVYNYPAGVCHRVTA